MAAQTIRLRTFLYAAYASPLAVCSFATKTNKFFYLFVRYRKKWHLSGNNWLPTNPVPRRSIYHAGTIDPSSGNNNELQSCVYGYL